MDTTLPLSSLQQMSPLLVSAELKPAPQLLIPATQSTNPRRLPPPCWSHDETVALIDSYRDKWYILRRGHLKTNHWQEVAEAVAQQCPIASPSKTAVQCRHKMEKLRQRYKTEIQRARSMPVSRFSSSWVHFKRMDSMDKGPLAKPSYISGSDHDNEADDSDQEFYENGVLNNIGSRGSDNISMHKIYQNGSSSSGGRGFKIKIPTGVSIAQSAAPHKFYAKADNSFSPHCSPNLDNNNNPNSKFGIGTRVYRNLVDKGRKVREPEAVEEMVQAVKLLGDGFVRIEQMKMDMAREMEKRRMDMEMRRTEMILESQHGIVEAFAKAMSDSKKQARRMPML